MIRIEAAALESLVTDIFSTHGCDDAEAARVGYSLVGANLAGHDSHGVLRVPRYVEWLDAGFQVANQHIDVVTESDAFAVVEGNFGMGQTIGPEAVQIGIDKALAGGVALIALRHAGHLGRIGEWAEMAAAAGLFSLHFVNLAGGLLVAPFGSIDRRMATNPVTIGAPVPDGPPVICDFATSVVAEGKVHVALEGGPAVPHGSLISADGELTDDPSALLRRYAPRPIARSEAGHWCAQGDGRAQGLCAIGDV